MTDVKKPAPAELADLCGRLAEEKLAEHVLKIHVGPQSSVADWFVIATANSEPQLRALANFIERQLRDLYKIHPLSENGETASGWILLDFGSVIVHLMLPETRDRYNLEGLWGEVPSEEAIRTLAEKH